jgi:hypothetical protein
MPRLPIDYSNTIIYKIVCNDLDIIGCYVGHTTDFIRRKQQHKTVCYKENRKPYNFKVYSTIRENGGWDNWTMVEVEKYPCKDANEATAKEREWFERLNSSLNMIYPQRCQSEYYEDCIEELRFKQKQYHKDHKEEIKIKQSENYQDHKEEIRTQQSQYREDHKDTIASKRKEKVMCQCGKICTNGNKANHKRSRKHLHFISTMEVSLSVSADTI